MVSSPSQASPIPSPSVSACVGLATSWQLSVPVQCVLAFPGLQTPSMSASTCTCEQPLGSTAASDAVPGQASKPVHPDGPPLGAPGSQKPSASASTCASEQPFESTAAAGVV